MAGPLSVKPEQKKGALFKSLFGRLEFYLYESLLYRICSPDKTAFDISHRRSQLPSQKQSTKAVETHRLTGHDEKGFSNSRWIKYCARIEQRRTYGTIAFTSCLTYIKQFVSIQKIPLCSRDIEHFENDTLSDEAAFCGHTVLPSWNKIRPLSAS